MLKQRRILGSACNPIEIRLLNLPLLFEAVAQDLVRFVRDPDANASDVAVLECAVQMNEGLVAVSVEPQHTRCFVLVVIDLVAEADSDVASARAALVRIDIQVFEGPAGGLFGDGTRRPHDDDEREGDGRSRSAKRTPQLAPALGRAVVALLDHLSPRDVVARQVRLPRREFNRL